MTTQTPWRKGAVEVIVIVLGISIALAADALWSARVERQDEQEALGRLYDDFSAALQAMESPKAAHQENLEAFSEMLRLIAAGGVPPGSYQVPDSLLLAIYGTYAWTPPLGALQSLLSAGDIALIRNDSLRAELTAWPEVVKRVNGEEASDRLMYEQVQLPITFQTVPYVSVIHRKVGDYASESPLEPDYGRLLTDLTFENVMEWRLVNTSEILTEYDSAGRTLQRIRAILASELK